jgi:hypothetical protein
MMSAMIAEVCKTSHPTFEHFMLWQVKLMSEFGNLVINAYGLFRINVHKVKNKRPALVRCSTGSVADSVGAKIGIFSEISKKNAKFFKFFLLMPPS